MFSAVDNFKSTLFTENKGINVININRQPLFEGLSTNIIITISS